MWPIVNCLRYDSPFKKGIDGIRRLSTEGEGDGTKGRVPRVRTVTSPGHNSYGGYAKSCMTLGLSTLNLGSNGTIVY